MIENIDTLLSDPYIVTGIAIAVIVAYHYIKRMPYSEFVFVTQVKHRVALILETTNFPQLLEAYNIDYPILDKVARLISSLRLTTTKQYRNDDEFIATVEKSPKELAKEFKKHNINQHLIAGSKRRKTPNGLQWAHTQWAYQHSSGKQTEIWLYINGDGTVDIYGHHEDSVFDPDGHLTTPYTPGDPKGVLDPILA